GGGRAVRMPKVVAGDGGYGAGNVEAATAKLSTLRAVRFEELGALVGGLDLAQLARRDVGIEHIEPFIVGEEQRRVAPRSRRRECAAAAATVRRRRRQIPERQSGESSARADQQR